jgi:uncharacterized membrane protein YebE (DUF533 family)
MLADGVISDEEADVIQREAKRLHLSEEEVHRLMVKARQERDLKNDVSVMPLHKIAANPEHAIEHYKVLLSQIRQIGVMTDREQFERVAQSLDRLTATELALWLHIQGPPTSQPTTTPTPPPSA